MKAIQRAACTAGLSDGLASMLIFVMAFVLAGCGSLLPSPPPTPSFYRLGSVGPALRDQPLSAIGPTLLVHPMRAASGFDSTHIVYSRSPSQLEHFARSEWADTPARMLAPWLVEVLIAELVGSEGKGGSGSSGSSGSSGNSGGSGGVGAVLLAPSSALNDYSLDTDLIRLQQDFSVQPSQVRLTLRVSLIQTSTRRVLGVREFDASQPSATDDPRGGVQAAQAAAARVLQEVAQFCKRALPVK
ncbi:MAG: membrane integrity-associated transporter subunit PqiC [Pseudorhodobacter sp.]|nr:membrane integrity-associated transporter subunit PqiC [Rhizobacter sp.]